MLPRGATLTQPAAYCCVWDAAHNLSVGLYGKTISRRVVRTMAVASSHLDLGDSHAINGSMTFEEIDHLSYSC